MDIADALERVAPVMDAKIAEYEREHAVCRAYEQCYAAIENTPLCWHQYITPDRVLCSTSNRGGFGVVASTAMALGSAHVKSGYSYKKACSGAVASSIPTQTKDLQQLISWNKTMDSAQDGPIFSSTPQAASMGAGHTNYFLRLCNAEAACSFTQLAPNGRLDPVQLGQRHPDLGKALKEGLHWQVIHWSVFERWPKLADIIQKALNTADTQEVSEVEGLVGMANTAMQHACASGDLIPWASVLADAVVFRPMWTGWGKIMIELVKHTPAPIINELGQNAAALLKKSDDAETLASVHVGGSYFEKVLSIKMAGLVQPHRFRCAVLLANMLAPVAKVDGGKAVLITSQHVASLSNKVNGSKIFLMEKCLDFAAAAAQNLHGDAACVARPRGCMAARLVYHCLGLAAKSADKTVYADAYSICQVGNQLKVQPRNTTITHYHTHRFDQNT